MTSALVDKGPRGSQQVSYSCGRTSSELPTQPVYVDKSNTVGYCYNLALPACYLSPVN